MEGSPNSRGRGFCDSKGVLSNSYPMMSVDCYASVATTSLETLGPLWFGVCRRKLCILAAWCRGWFWMPSWKHKSLWWVGGSESLRANIHIPFNKKSLVEVT